MRDEDGETRSRRLRREGTGHLFGQPGRHRDEAGITGGIAQRERVGHHAALTEAHQDELAGVYRVLAQQGVEKSSQLVDGSREGREVRRSARTDGKPAVAHLALADLHRHRALRTQHQRLAAVKEGSDSQKIVRVRAPAVQHHDGREGALTRGYVSGVHEIHTR